MATTPESTGATQRWLAKARITDDPAGDLIADLRRQQDIPRLLSNIEDLRGYLRSKRACSEAMTVVPIVWRRYRNWLDRHPWG